MVSPDAAVAVVGGARLLGRAVAEQLDRRGVRPDRLRLSETAAEAGRVQEIAGEASVVAEVDRDLLALADEVFLCVGEEEAEPLLGGPRARGSIWVDLSGAGAARPRVPLVNLSANPGSLPKRPSGLVAAPGPEAQFLSTLLVPLIEGRLIRRLRAVLMLPASSDGEPGLDELYRQAVNLLNFGDVPREVFGAQLAFNVLPADPAVAARAVRETARILRPTRGRLTATALHAPVFHGHGIVAHVETTDAGSPASMEEALARAADVEVVREAAEATPAALAGRTEIVAARPRDDGTGRGAWLWAACDDLAAGAARNAVRIAGACRGG